MHDRINPYLEDREVLAVKSAEGPHQLISPHGLEHAYVPVLGLGGVSVEQLRKACDRYAARKTTVPGSYAHRHYVETGHAFGFGCCLGTESA